MIIMKFGGSSVGGRDAMRSAARSVRMEMSRRPVVVVSALFGVTDLLVRAGAQAEAGDVVGALEAADAIEARHREGFAEFPPELEAMLAELRSFLRAHAGRARLAEEDWASLLSFGERMSIHIVSSVFRESGLDAMPVDAREFMRLEGKHGNADVNRAVTGEAARSRFDGVPEGAVPVVTGFIGADERGETALLGRGGSDYTASILGEALGVEEIVICKEVDGILSADPRVVKDAGLLSRISYDEAAEMSYFGAKVLHPKTMIPAVRAGIPIRIRNTFNPDAPGTLISGRSDVSGEGVKSVSAHRGLSMITLEGKGMAGITGFAANLFSVAGRLGVNIVMFTQASSEQTICLVVDAEEGTRLQEALKNAFGDEMSTLTVDAIRVSHDVAAIAVVGDGMRGKVGIAGKVFSSVAETGVSVHAIAQGSSERNISFIVDGKDADKVIRGIHASLRLATKEPAKEESYA